PANPLGLGSQLLQGSILDLAHALLADAEQVADLAEAVSAVPRQAEAQVEDLALARPEVLHQEREGLLALRVLAERVALVVRHRLGQFEVAVIIEDRVQRDGGARRGLQVSQVLEARTGAVSQLLRAGQVLAAVSQRLGLLLQQAQLLQMMRRQAD